MNLLSAGAGDVSMTPLQGNPSMSYFHAPCCWFMQGPHANTLVCLTVVWHPVQIAYTINVDIRSTPSGWISNDNRFTTSYRASKYCSTQPIPLNKDPSPVIRSEFGRMLPGGEA